MRVPFRASWLLVGGAVGAAVLTNCWSLSEPLGPDGNGGTAAGGASGGTGGGAGAAHGGGGATGGGATGGGGMLPCDPAGAPEPPLSSSTTTAGGRVFAIRSVTFSLPNSEAPGFDLDDLCSCAPDPEDCTPTDGAGPHCDRPGGGRDNTLGPALDGWLANVGQPTATTQFGTGARDGEWTLLIEVPEVTLPNDVEAAPVIASTGGTCCGGAAPLWNGLDEWPVNTGFETGTDQSTWQSENAHVTANVLVAHFPLLDIRMRHGDFWLGVRMRDAVLSASLELGEAPASLNDGVISGVVSEEDLFWGLDTIQIGGYRLCLGGEFYPGAKAAVCGARDLGSGGAGSSCESVSFGLAFTATEVVRTSTVDETGGSNCSAGTRPIEDRCDGPVGGGGAFRRSR